MSKLLTKKQREQADKLKHRAVLGLRDPATNDKDCDRLRDAMKEILSDPRSLEDAHTLEVRRGVSLNGYEVLLRDRLLTVSAGLVAAAIKFNTLDKLAKSYLDRLRSRLFAGQEPSIAQYRVIDMERERLAELEEILREMLGERELTAFLERTLVALVKKICPPDKELRPITLIRSLRRACAELILNHMRGVVED